MAEGSGVEFDCVCRGDLRISSSDIFGTLLQIYIQDILANFGQNVLEDRPMLPERQELFTDLVSGAAMDCSPCVHACVPPVQLAFFNITQVHQFRFKLVKNKEQR